MKKKLNSSNKAIDSEKANLGGTFISVSASIVKASVNYSKENQDKLVALAEKQTNHIIHMEKELLEEQKKNGQLERKLIQAQVNGQLKYTLRGQAAALIVILAGLLFGAFVIYLGYPPIGITGIIISIGAIASQFLDRIKPHSNKKLQNSVEKQD